MEFEFGQAVVPSDRNIRVCTPPVVIAVGPFNAYEPSTPAGAPPLQLTARSDQVSQMAKSRGVSSCNPSMPFSSAVKDSP